MKEKKLIALQYKLKNLNCDLDITGITNDKTTTVYIIEKHLKQKFKRKK